MGSLLFRHPASWRRLSEVAVTGERQIADARTCGGENCVAKRGHERWHSRLSHAGGRRAALRNIDVGLGRYFVDTSHRIVIEIGLLDYTVPGGNLPAANDARAEDHRAFELRARCFRIHDESGIHRGINTRDANLAVIGHLHLNSRGHISQETAMRGESKPMSLYA